MFPRTSEADGHISPDWWMFSQVDREKIGRLLNLP